jgi:hypothetical protein
MEKQSIGHYAIFSQNVTILSLALTILWTYLKSYRIWEG